MSSDKGPWCRHGNSGDCLDCVREYHENRDNQATRARIAAIILSAMIIRDDNVSDGKNVQDAVMLADDLLYELEK